ncbi:MAG: 2Fe-2S iron-sulfur cluster-binding protein, partial [Hyphomicrobiaceae bacterium]
MRKLHAVTINGETFSARSGQLILDAAMLNGVELPHDCRAGQCGTCLGRVLRGITLGGETLQPGMVHTCQARVFSSLELAVDDLPPPGLVDARAIGINDLTHDVAEVILEPAKPLKWLPGQYCRFAFHGFPSRAYSPTAPLDGSAAPGQIRLNVKRVRDGRVSSKLGRQILPGHKVRIEGPYGHAFLRPARGGRLVLVAAGTGFAPIWAIATAALRKNPYREIVLIVGVGSLASCYMAGALEFASTFPNVRVILSVDKLHPAMSKLRSGPPCDHLPDLMPHDVVFSAGAPAMVAKVAAQASA